MPPTDRTNPDLEAAHTRQHDADETQEDALDAGHGEYEDEAYDDDDIYDDEEYLHQLLGQNGSIEDIGRQKTYTWPSRDVSPEAVTRSGGASGRPGFVDDQGALYEDSLQPSKRSSGTVAVATTVHPGQPLGVAAGISMENSVGPTPSTGSAVAAETGGLSAGMTTTGESVTGGVEQLASLVTGCLPAQNDDLVNNQESTPSKPLMGQGAAGAGQLQPCGRNVHLVARQLLHRGPSADLSGTGGTSEQLASSTSDARDLELEIHSPVIIDGLEGGGQERAGDADTGVQNADLHRGNNYNIGNVDSNIDFPSGGANRSSSPETNIHLVVTPDEQVHAVRPLPGGHQDETGQPRSAGQIQPGYNASTGRNHSHDNMNATTGTNHTRDNINASTGRNQTRDLISSNLRSPDTTNTSQSMARSPLGPSLSDAISASQLDMSSISHAIISPGFLVIPTQRHAGSHIHGKHDSTFTNGLTASISTLTVSPTFSSTAVEFQMTELWSELTQLPATQPQSTDPWHFDNNGHNRKQGDMPAVDILPTRTTVHERVQDTTKHVWSSDINHAKIERDYTLEITSSTATTLTPSIEDVGHPVFTDHSPTHTSGIAIVLATPSYSTPSPELEISAIPVAEIMSATIAISTHGPSREDSTTKADNPPEDRTSPTTPEVAVASTWPTNESTWPPGHQSVSASSLTSAHPPTVAGDSTESQFAHTKPSQSSADIGRLASETSGKPETNPTLPGKKCVRHHCLTFSSMCCTYRYQTDEIV